MHACMHALSLRVLVCMRLCVRVIDYLRVRVLCVSVCVCVCVTVDASARARACVSC